MVIGALHRTKGIQAIAEERSEPQAKNDDIESLNL